jgi:hypothetical protein
MWFDPPETFSRSRDDKRMKKIASDSEAEETGKIQKWLDLAAKLFETDATEKEKKSSTGKIKRTAGSHSDVA